VGGAVDLVGEGAAALGDDDLALLEELVGDIDGLVEQAAGVVAEIDDEAVQGAGGLEVVQGVAHLAAGGLHEVGDVDVADAGLEQEGEIDGVAGNLVAHEVEGERAVMALALDGDQDVCSFGPLEHGGDGGGVEAIGALAVDREDEVSGTDSGLEGGRALERGKHHDVQDAGFVRQGLDGHADAVVLAVLLLAHLGEGFGVVKVGVGSRACNMPGWHRRRWRGRSCRRPAARRSSARPGCRRR